jgi:hypothetical protein
MSATARKHDPIDPARDLHAELLAGSAGPEDPITEATADIGDGAGSLYATRGARGLRAGRPHLRMVSPLRTERASRGVFALVVTGLLVLGMVLILVINTSLAQGAFTISELQTEQATLTQQEQTLSEQVANAGAPESLETQARAMGMVPSQTPVFLSVPSGRVLGKAKAAPGGTGSAPVLRTPADATVTEAVNNASVGTDLPVALGPGYDPAAADAAAVEAAAASTAALAAGQAKAARSTRNPGKKAAARRAQSENSMWGDSTIIDVTSRVASNDAGLVAVPVD